MENDTISRSALVAELEAFKMSLGDIVLRFVVDRVIDVVKAQPAVEVQHLSPLLEKECWNCRHFENSASDYPCCACRISAGEPSRWEPQA